MKRLVPGLTLAVALAWIVGCDSAGSGPTVTPKDPTAGKVADQAGDKAAGKSRASQKAKGVQPSGTE